MATKTVQALSNLGSIANGSYVVGEAVAGTTGKFTIAASGTGNVVLSTSPTLVTPALGTPSSGVITNCTGSPTLTSPLLGTPASGVLTNCTGLPVAGGGTGRASHTAYSVLCGGTTSTAAQQSVASVGTAGQWLTSAGAGALPTFKGGLNVFRATMSADQTITGPNVITKVQFNSQNFDTGAGYDASTYRFTPNIAGKYLIYSQIMFYSTVPTSTQIVLVIYKNGGAVLGKITKATLFTYPTASVSDILSLNGTTDYVEMYAYQSDAASQDIYGSLFTYQSFSGTLLEAT